MKNWSEVHELTKKPVARPASEAEVCELVRRATAAGRRLRVVGSGHSWSDVAAAPDTLVSLEKIADFRGADAERLTATFGGGMKIHALNAELRKRGLCVAFNCSTVMPTFVGAAATGSHASSLAHGNFGSLLRAVRLVDGSGDVRVLRVGDALWPALGCSLGALGIITEATIAVQPAFKLAEETFPLPWAEALATLPQLARSAEYVKVWWVPGHDTVHVARYNRVADPAAPETWSALRRALDNSVQRWVLPAAFRLSDSVPSTVTAFNTLFGAALLGTHKTVGKPEDVLSTQMPAVHRELEYSMPLDAAVEAMRRVRALIEAHGLKVNFILEVRFVARDESWLSPDYGRDSVRVGCYTAYAKDCGRYFELAEAAFMSLRGVPHWGKETVKFGAAHVRERFPESLGKFLTAARALDPAGTFTNAWTERMLGLGQPARARL